MQCMKCGKVHLDYCSDCFKEARDLLAQITELYGQTDVDINDDPISGADLVDQLGPMIELAGDFLKRCETPAAEKPTPEQRASRDMASAHEDGFWDCNALIELGMSPHGIRRVLLYAFDIAKTSPEYVRGVKKRLHDRD